MKHKFFDRRLSEYNIAMIQALQNLTTLLEEEKCLLESRQAKRAVNVLLQLESLHQRTITVIETDIKNALNSD
ncbi:MAG: hypothetical protein N2235_21165 [Fischerella sp.]|nr:hypothetical protein [Fischerella sp.]